MNFQELMSKASANSAIASRQNFTKSGHKHKASGPGVSNSAVKSFLERKEKEQKKKKADEEAAKRARIQARLQQSLQGNQEKKDKPESTPKSSFLNPPYAREEEEQAEKSMPPVRRKRDAGAGQHPSAGGSAKPSTARAKDKDMDRTATTNNQRTTTKGKSGRPNDFLENGKRSESSKAKKKKKAPPPPNFKELLVIAEQNKFGLKPTKSKPTKSKPTKSKPATVTGKSKTEVGEKKVKRLRHGSGDVSQMDEKNMRSRNNGKVNEKAIARAKGKQTVTHQKTRANEPDKRAREGSKTLKRTRDSDTIGKTVLDKKPSQPYARPQEPQLRLSYYSKPSRNYDYDDEEDSDLDGFIDDGEDEGCVDVSRCIKDIFGYDRRRYAMDDGDDSAMESNYNQIEREEKRSAKIAKLEDEIEILKEQAELKRMRDKLKKSQKTRK